MSQRVPTKSKRLVFRTKNQGTEACVEEVRAKRVNILSQYFIDNVLDYFSTYIKTVQHNGAGKGEGSLNENRMRYGTNMLKYYTDTHS